MSVDGGPLLVCLAACALAVALLMAGCLLVALRTRLLRVVDTIWGAGFALVAVVAFVVSVGTGADTDPLARWLMLVLPVAWGARLTFHLAGRNRGRPEDPRYAELLERSDGTFAGVAVRRVFLPQAAVMWFVSLPVQVGAYAVDLVRPLAVVGVGVWAVGVFFETVGDAQLAAFQADPGNRGTVMDRGLWAWTRHPNYFGDACCWWGTWLVAASSWWGLLTIGSPLLMNWTLARKTGKATLERSLGRSKPGYAGYVRRTSGFFPRPPRRCHKPDR